MTDSDPKGTVISARLAHKTCRGSLGKWLGTSVHPREMYFLDTWHVTRSRKNRSALELGSTTVLVKFCPCLKLLFLIFRQTSKNKNSCYLTPRLRDIKQKKIINISIPESPSHFFCFQSTQAKSKVWILIIQNWPVGFRDTFHLWFCFRKSYIIYKRRWHDCSLQKAYWPVLGSTFLHNFIILNQ